MRPPYTKPATRVLAVNDAGRKAQIESINRFNDMVRNGGLKDQRLPRYQVMRPAK